MAYHFWQLTAANEDIAGEGYRQLMDLAFRYSRYFSLTFLHTRRGVDPMEELNPFLFASYRSDEELWYAHGASATVKIYHATDAARHILREYAPSLFAWEAYEAHRPAEALWTARHIREQPLSSRQRRELKRIEQINRAKHHRHYR